jgi:hypothetical protein
MECVFHFICDDNQLCFFYEFTELVKKIIIICMHMHNHLIQKAYFPNHELVQSYGIKKMENKT